MDKHEIKPGCDVIVVHNYHTYTQGDILTVFGICQGCDGLIFQGDYTHHNREHFDFFIEGEKKIHVPEDYVSKEKVVGLYDDIAMRITLNSIDGMVPIAAIGKVLEYNIDKLGIRQYIMTPKNASVK